MAEAAPACRQPCIGGFALGVPRFAFPFAVHTTVACLSRRTGGFGRAGLGFWDWGLGVTGARAGVQVGMGTVKFPRGIWGLSGMVAGSLCVWLCSLDCMCVRCSGAVLGTGWKFVWACGCWGFLCSWLL